MSESIMVFKNKDSQNIKHISIKYTHIKIYVYIYTYTYRFNINITAKNKTCMSQDFSMNKKKYIQQNDKVGLNCVSHVWCSNINVSYRLPPYSPCLEICSKTMPLMTIGANKVKSHNIT